VLTQRNTTTEVSFEDVVSRFEAEQPELTKDTTVDALEPEQTSDAPIAKPADEDTPEKARAAVADAPDPYVLPEEGVYIYRTTGGEQVSVFGAKHDYPSRTYSTVRHAGGCRWEQRNDVIEEHTDVRKVCSKRDELLQVAQARYVTFFGQREGDELACEPWASFHGLEDAKGATSSSVCRGDDGEAHLTRTFVGMEPMVIEGEIVQAVRVHLDGTITGTHEGTSTDDLWLSRRTGLPLRWDRTVDIVSSAYGADVRYTEDASFTIESLDPQR
jgi:hypothetical protein